MNRLQDYSLTLKGIWKYSRFLKRSQSFSNDEIITNQSKWLSRLFIHAHKNIPWYSALFREHGIDVNSVNPLQELKKIPILTKEQVRAHHADFCISGVAKRSVKFSTSGTTGEPLTAYTSFNQWIIECWLVIYH